ncbi:hypothetical protein ACFXOL_10925 [Streptomyces californicus]|uniref:hypothetical protein n=1 Tax=Streptomyces californicus TaxID=67351 RepID=UPI00365662D5
MSTPLQPAEGQLTVPKKITVHQADGEVIETTVSDDSVAREYEELPFQVDHIVNVTVADADD